MFFAEYADSVTMLVRGSSLAASMSQYLVDRLAGRRTSRWSARSKSRAWRAGQPRGHRCHVGPGSAPGAAARATALFVLIGGEPQTAWLPDAVIRDQWGFVCTGRDVMDLLHERPPATWPLERDPFLLETSIPGVLAAGDVRHGSIKRSPPAWVRAAWQSPWYTSIWASWRRRSSGRRRSGADSSAESPSPVAPTNRQPVRRRRRAAR